MKKVKKELSYRDIVCDSEQEIWILQWLFELLDRGYLYNIARSESFKLSEPLKFTYKVEKVLKTKVKVVDKTATLLHGHIYTPEFRVFLTPKGKILDFPKGPLVVDKHNTAYIEVKNDDFDFNNMNRLNQINRKWLFKDHGVYVTVLKPKDLFSSTFTPNAYLKTATGKDRKINFKVRTFEEWIKTI